MKEDIKNELKNFIDLFDNDKVFSPQKENEKKIVLNMFDELFNEFKKFERSAQTKDQAIKTFINKTLDEN